MCGRAPADRRPGELRLRLRTSPRRFWNRRAREDPFFFVDDRLEYRRPDLESFWQGGEEAVDGTLQVLSVSLDPDGVAVDLGCGIGRITRALAHRVRLV